MARKTLKSDRYGAYIVHGMKDMLEPCKGFHLPAKELYNAFCELSEFKQDVISVTVWGVAMRQLGFKKIRRADGFYYEEVQLKEHYQYLIPECIRPVWKGRPGNN